MVERVSSRRKTAHDEASAADDAAGSRRAAVPKFDKKTIALVYDFDGTLSPKPMQEYAFLPKIGVDPAAFWAESNALAKRTQADPLITYMHLLYKKAQAKGVRIDRRDLVAQGRLVALFPGVEAWFDGVGEYVKSHAQSHGVTLRHYLISSGLVEIIEGTSIFKRFHNVFASEYWFEAYDLPYPKRVITDTGKTQYLFRINKGVEDLGAKHQPAHARGGAAHPLRQHDLLRRRRHRRAVDGGDAQERRPCAGGLSAGQVEGQVRRALQGRPLRFLRARRLPRRLRPLQAHLPAARPHPRRHPRAGGDLAHGAWVEIAASRALPGKYAAGMHSRIAAIIVVSAN